MSTASLPGWKRRLKSRVPEAVPQLLFDKILSRVDANESAGRLVLPGTRKDVFGRETTPITLSEVLTDSEKEIAGGEGEGLRVLLLDRKGRAYPGAVLRRRGNNSSYALKGSWFRLLTTNRLRTHDKVEVFFFRVGGRVGLTVYNIFKVPMPPVGISLYRLRNCIVKETRYIIDGVPCFRQDFNRLYSREQLEFFQRAAMHHESNEQ